MNILNKLKEKIKDNKKLAIAIGAGVVIVILASTVMFIGKKKGVSKTNNTVNVSNGTTTLDKKTANGLNPSESTVTGEQGINETSSFDIEGYQGEGFGSTETVAEDNSAEKQEETADISDDKAEADEVVDEEGDGFVYELDSEMESQDSIAESAVNNSDNSSGYSGDAAREYIYREIIERDNAQLEMGIQGGLGDY